MPREFYTYLSSHCRESSNFPSQGHENHIDFHALFMLGSLEPNIYILGQAIFDARDSFQHVLSNYTPVVHSSQGR